MAKEPSEITADFGPKYPEAFGSWKFLPIFWWLESRNAPIWCHEKFLDFWSIFFPHVCPEFPEPGSGFLLTSTKIHGIKDKIDVTKRCCCRTEQTTRYVVITVLAVLNVVTGVNLGTNLLGRHPVIPPEVVWCLIGRFGDVEKISPSEGLKRYHTIQV